MPLKLLYFARLRERLGTIGETLELPDSAHDVSVLLKLLCKRCGKLGKRAYRQPGADCRQPEHDVPAHLLQADDEVALFPPVTGG
jgi:molybdopterin synthase sulfur carrier subunit